MTMPAGRYYVGDLCYVIKDNSDWDTICSNAFPPGHNYRGIDGEFTLADGRDGRRYAMYSTAHGDGDYTDRQGRHYAVDSGSIGCILVDDIPNIDDEGVYIDLGQIITFDLPFETHSHEGVIYFGDVSIDTDYTNTPYDDDYYEDDNALEDEF